MWIINFDIAVLVTKIHVYRVAIGNKAVERYKIHVVRNYFNSSLYPGIF